jgi:hypothetical protein
MDMGADISKKDLGDIPARPLDKREELAKVLRMFALREGIVTKLDLKRYLEKRPVVKVSSAQVLREMRGQ